jgi:glutamine amidotransferase
MPEAKITAAIVDYGLGNLFSVKHACSHAGIEGTITSDRDDLLKSDVVILPGVGAYRDAMASLHKLDLVSVMQDISAAGKPLVGICLGMQLLMTRSYEFGNYLGLGIIDGPVVRFEEPKLATENGQKTLKVPQICWNQIYHPEGKDNWDGTYLEGLDEGTYMYFVHSYYAQPDDPAVWLTETTYGDITFCSGLRRDNVFACQFHPERSGPLGLKVYDDIARMI